MERAYNEMKIEDMLEGKYKEIRISKGEGSRNFAKKTQQHINTSISRNSIKPISIQEEIFIALNKKGVLPPSYSMNSKSHQFQDSNKYYKYHHDRGHNIDDCKYLGRVIAQIKENEGNQGLQGSSQHQWT